MKKLLFFAPFIITMLVLPCLVSAQTSQASTDALDAAIARTEEARKKAVDFESPSYFPGEWDAAETRYIYAGHEKTPVAYDSATDAYNSIFHLTIPLYAQAREDEIMTLRKSLVAAGVRAFFPDIFALADKIALSARDQYKEQDYYTARSSAAQALLMYQTMNSTNNAWLAQREIKGREFEVYDTEHFNRAGEILNDAIAAYKAGNYPLAQENANEALIQYNLVLSVGWATYAEMRFSLADAERRAALDIKADIAVRDLFTEADSTYKTSIDFYDSQNYEEAAKQFINSETMFIAASSLASEKRQNAAETIKEAREKVEKSSETARQAEILIKGRSK
jgi:hypothetical protein